MANVPKAPKILVCFKEGNKKVNDWFICVLSKIIQDSGRKVEYQTVSVEQDLTNKIREYSPNAIFFVTGDKDDDKSLIEQVKQVKEFLNIPCYQGGLYEISNQKWQQMHWEGIITHALSLLFVRCDSESEKMLHFEKFFLALIERLTMTGNEGLKDHEFLVWIGWLYEIIDVTTGHVLVMSSSPYSGPVQEEIEDHKKSIINLRSRRWNIRFDYAKNINKINQKKEVFVNFLESIQSQSEDPSPLDY